MGRGGHNFAIIGVGYSDSKRFQNFGRYVKKYGQYQTIRNQSMEAKNQENEKKIAEIRAKAHIFSIEDLKAKCKSAESDFPDINSIKISLERAESLQKTSENLISLINSNEEPIKSMDLDPILVDFRSDFLKNGEALRSNLSCLLQSPSVLNSKATMMSISPSISKKSDNLYSQYEEATVKAWPLYYQSIAEDPKPKNARKAASAVPSVAALLEEARPSLKVQSSKKHLQPSIKRSSSGVVSCPKSPTKPGESQLKPEQPTSESPSENEEAKEETKKPKKFNLAKFKESQKIANVIPSVPKPEVETTQSQSNPVLRVNLSAAAGRPSAGIPKPPVAPVAGGFKPPSAPVKPTEQPVAGPKPNLGFKPPQAAPVAGAPPAGAPPSLGVKLPAPSGGFKIGGTAPLKIPQPSLAPKQQVQPVEKPPAFAAPKVEAKPEEKTETKQEAKIEAKPETKPEEKAEEVSDVPKPIPPPPDESFSMTHVTSFTAIKPPASGGAQPAWAQKSGPAKPAATAAAPGASWAKKSATAATAQGPAEIGSGSWGPLAAGPISSIIQSTGVVGGTAGAWTQQKNATATTTQPPATNVNKPWAPQTNTPAGNAAQSWNQGAAGVAPAWTGAKPQTWSQSGGAPATGQGGFGSNAGVWGKK